MINDPGLYYKEILLIYSYLDRTAYVSKLLSLYHLYPIIKLFFILFEYPQYVLDTTILINEAIIPKATFNLYFEKYAINNMDDPNNEKLNTRVKKFLFDGLYNPTNIKYGSVRPPFPEVNRHLIALVSLHKSLDELVLDLGYSLLPPAQWVERYYKDVYH